MPEFKVDGVTLDPIHPAVTALPYAEAAMRSVLAQAIGFGSNCWVEREDGRIFDSIAALAGVEAAMTALIDVTKLGSPTLGCATNAELLAELEGRQRMGHTASDYRTVC